MGKIILSILGMALVGSFAFADEKLSCEKVKYSDLEPSSVLVAKRKSQEDKFNAEKLKEATDSFNLLCEQVSCLKKRDKVSLDEIMKKYVGGLDWVKTPYQKSLQFKTFKDLELESCTF